jgi:putative addiction module component (TIGR02574 family)
MNTVLEELKVTLSSLPTPERAELAYFLLQSLEPAEAGETDASRTELTRRVGEIRAGKVVGKPVEEALAQLRERYP